MEIYDIFIIGKGDNEICDGGAYVSDHDSADDQHSHMTDDTGGQDDETHAEQRAGKGCKNHHP